MNTRGLTIIEVLLASALAASVVTAGVGVLRAIPTTGTSAGLERSAVLERSVDDFLLSRAGMDWRRSATPTGVLDGSWQETSAIPPRVTSAAYELVPLEDGSLWLIVSSDSASTIRWLPPMEAAR